MTEAIAPAVGQADVQFADPAVRVRIRAWHEEGVSLLDMGNRLGIVGPEGLFIDFRRHGSEWEPEQC